MVREEVVWTEGQRVARRTVWAEAFKAAVFHYQRCFFGAQYGMKGATA